MSGFTPSGSQGTLRAMASSAASVRIDRVRPHAAFRDCRAQPTFFLLDPESRR